MKRWVVIASVVTIGVAIALAYGGGVGSANQVTYLLEPLRRANIDLFARDWLTSDTTHYHGAFIALATELFRADPTGATSFGVAHLLAMVATIAALHGILVALGLARHLSLLLLLAGFIALGGGRAIGGSYLVATYFQPSSIATVAWLAALALWVRDRHLAAGVALAIGGAFHANFLILGILWFGVVDLLGGPGLAGTGARSALFRRRIALLAPSLVVLAAMWPSIRAAGDAAEPSLALRILVEFHAPTHYDASVAIAQLPPLLGWLLAAWACDPSRDPRLARMFTCAVVGTAMCTWIFLAILIAPSATRLFVWRIAPFAQLASQIVVVAIVFSDHALPTSGATGAGRWRALGIPIGIGVVLGWSIPHAGGRYTAALAAAIAAAIGYRAAPSRARSVAGRAPIIAGVLVATLAIAPVARKLASPDLFTEALGGRYRDLILWARTTDRDALFVIPPYVHAFRFLARRAIVADSRSPPLYPDELVAWYRRLCAIAGVESAATHEEIEARYDRLTAEQLEAAARRFEAQYIVIDKQRSSTRPAGTPAFEDWRVVVFAVPPR